MSAKPRPPPPPAGDDLAEKLSRRAFTKEIAAKGMRGTHESVVLADEVRDLCSAAAALASYSARVDALEKQSARFEQLWLELLSAEYLAAEIAALLSKLAIRQ